MALPRNGSARVLRAPQERLRWLGPPNSLYCPPLPPHLPRLLSWHLTRGGLTTCGGVKYGAGYLMPILSRFEGCPVPFVRRGGEQASSSQRPKPAPRPLNGASTAGRACCG